MNQEIAGRRRERCKLADTEALAIQMSGESVETDSRASRSAPDHEPEPYPSGGV